MRPRPVLNQYSVPSVRINHRLQARLQRIRRLAAAEMEKKAAASNDDTKSPKLTRTESIGERTMQKISKVIRGSSRSDSRSKKTREASVSPQGQRSSSSKKDLSSKEKRDLYKTSSSGGGGNGAGNGQYKIPRHQLS